MGFCPIGRREADSFPQMRVVLCLINIRKEVIMEKIVNDKEYPQQYTWTKFLSHVLVVFILLFIMVQVIKTLSE